VKENSGKKTPGVDGEVWDDPEQKAHALHTPRRRGYQARPLRRVYIPKGNSDKMRPLGIPTIRDRAMQAWPAGEWIQQLNPLLRGWTLYHRHAHSSRTFAYVDRVLRNCLWRWARRRHRRRTWAWIGQRYFPRRAEGATVFRGVATDKAGRKKAVFLFHPPQQRIRRHVLIRGEANPFDPECEEYFEQRSLRGMANLTGPKPAALFVAEATRMASSLRPTVDAAAWLPDAPPSLAGIRGVRIRHTIWNCFTPTVIGRSIVRVVPWIKPRLRWRRRLQRLEPYAVKVARTVLRGGGDGNVTSLPDPQASEVRGDAQ
jgi:hypothetical protein